MKVSYSEIQAFSAQHSSEQHEILQSLERRTYLETLAPQMLSGHLQGLFLRSLVRWNGAKSILDIGTFTGYSAFAMALELPADGQVTTLEVNKEYQHFHDHYFSHHDIAGKIQVLYGDALAIIPTLQATFDVVYIDAGKQDYLAYYQMVLPMVRSGGVICADNVLWSGKVINNPEDQDAAALIRFAKHVQRDDQVMSTLLPIREGLLVMTKR